MTVALMAGERGAQIKVVGEAKTPSIIAVRFHHDMCPYCQKLAPEYAKLTERGAESSVLMITMDLSNETTQRQSALLLGALGLERLWTGDLSMIGTVVFVDGTSKEVLTTYRAVEKGHLSGAMKQALRERSQKH